VVIVFDATSPPEVLRRFVWSCRRKRQRIYRRDWLDTWWRQLQRFEAVVFLWQTSHVGAPVNEWADQAAAEAALAGLGERTPELLAVEYASLELEQADGQLIRGGPRATATAAAQLEVERRLAVGCGSVQMVEACDLDLPRLPDRLGPDWRRATVQRANRAAYDGGVGVPIRVWLQLCMARRRFHVHR